MGSGRRRQVLWERDRRMSERNIASEETSGQKNLLA
jgi:hypothetical protein